MWNLIAPRISKNNFFSEIEILKVLLQCLQGLKHLKKFNISHRDIKPDNILLKNKKMLEIMLADFGQSKIVIDD